MRKLKDLTLNTFIFLMTGLGVLTLGFVVFYIVREALPILSEVSLSELLTGNVWMPIDMIGYTSFGLYHYICATVYVSVLAMIIAFFFSIGTALFLTLSVNEGQRSILLPFIDLLAGIPSVIYGFIGIQVLLKLFMKAGVKTGSCVLAASILLAVMLVPYMVSACVDSLLKMKERYLAVSDALGIDKWHAASDLLLPASMKYIIVSLVLAVGRAMGETMAVMMVVGNANLFPTLLGKSETIAGLIALEMGSAEQGSSHYHALYMAGLILLLLLVLINVVISLIRMKFLKEDAISY